MERKASRPIITDGVYFITCSTFHRKKFFSNPKYAQIVVDQWKHYELTYKFTLYAYCVMPDHYHVLVDVGLTRTISKILHAVNSYIVTLINRDVDKRMKIKIFQGRSWDEVIRNEAMFWQKVSYILLNPYREGLVSDPLDDYRFSNIGEWIKREDEQFVLDLFSQYKRWYE
jgi:putative transposase